MSGLVLRELQISDEKLFFDALHVPQDSKTIFALGYRDGDKLEAYIKKLEDAKNESNLSEEMVPSTFLVGIANGQIIGRVSIRHRLNQALTQVGGHIGYITLTPFRKKGYATEMLRQSLKKCRELGLTKVLLTCDSDNVGSIKTIESNGGRLDDKNPSVTVSETKKLRYWIQL